MFRELDVNFFVVIFLIVVPAYMANGFALLLGGGKPIDMGKNFIDGKRIFGEGKTLNGVIFGTIFGIFGYLIELMILSKLKIPISFYIQAKIYYFVLFGFFIAIGAVIGDLLGSFIKRRLGLPRGAPIPILDQLDFISFSLLLAYLFNNFFQLVTIDIYIILVVLISTFIAHRVGCYLAYKIGKKKEPW